MRHAHPSAALLFLCPNCTHMVRAALGMAGRRSACPVCDNLVSVPSVPTAVQDDAPTWIDLPVLAASE